MALLAQRREVVDLTVVEPDRAARREAVSRVAQVAQVVVDPEDPGAGPEVLVVPVVDPEVLVVPAVDPAVLVDRAVVAVEGILILRPCSPGSIRTRTAKSTAASSMRFRSK